VGKIKRKAREREGGREIERERERTIGRGSEPEEEVVAALCPLRLLWLL
jgi:hypothetical protein